MSGVKHQVLMLSQY